MKSLSGWQVFAHPESVRGPILVAPLPNVFIGEICEIRASITSAQVVAHAQVIGFQDRQTILSVLGGTSGLSRKMVIMPSGRRLQVAAGMPLLGAVLDATGKLVERLCPPLEGAMSLCGIDAPAPEYYERTSIGQLIPTGVRAIDGLLSCGVGQRVGIFAPAGCGKTTLMNMLIENMSADVFVVGLIGERGREVGEFTEWLRHSKHGERTVLVYSTSDASSVDRSNAAFVATTVAEEFRRQGKQVVLLLDSLTRFARALRDLALASGEVPARRGYPASVFNALPKLLERSGQTKQGSITAFYTVLLEGNEEDPLGDEIRSILDGHIYLSSKLAGQGHFPAIDVLRSNSRLFTQVADEDHQQLASKIRNNLARLEELQLFFDLGEYKPGVNLEIDQLIARKPALMGFLCQRKEDSCLLKDLLGEMNNATS